MIPCKYQTPREYKTKIAYSAVFYQDLVMKENKKLVTWCVTLLHTFTHLELFITLCGSVNRTQVRDHSNESCCFVHSRCTGHYAVQQGFSS